MEVPAPQSRSDYYLAKLAGMDTALPDPQTRLDAYLLEWAQNDAQYVTVGPAAVASFTTLRAAPLRYLLVSIMPVQSGTGDPAPENVRPISGWSAVNVWRTGKNLLPMTVYSGGVYNPTVGSTFNLAIADDAKQFTPNADNTVFSVDTTASNTTYTILCPVKDGEKYHLWAKIGGTTKSSVSYGYLDKDYKVLSRTNNTINGRTLNSSLGPGLNTQNCAFFYIVITNSGTAVEALTVETPQIEVGEAATDYEPYNGVVIPVTFGDSPGVVYGGVLNVLTGVLTVTQVMLTVENLPGLVYYSNAGYFRTSNLTNYDTEIAPIAEAYAGKTTVTSSSPDKSIGFASQRVAIKDTRFTDVDELKAAVGNTKVVLTLATPQTYQLTAQEVLTLLGANNIWSDAGDVTVEYRSN